MSRLRLCILGLLLTAATLPAAAGGLLLPKGPFAPLTGSLERAVIYRPGEESEVLLLQTTYRGPARPFCWLLAVPSRPAPDDIFSPSADFMDAVFARTAPVQQTDISSSSGPVAPGPPDRKPELAPGAVAGPLPLPARGREFGDWAATVLAARSARTVLDWLRTAGYGAPEGLDSDVDAYLQRGWCLVALEARPRVEGDGVMFRSLPPVGLRFDTQAVVYPLSLTRLGARERTAVELAVITGASVLSRPVTCRDVTGRVALRRGRSVAAELERLAGSNLLRQAAVLGACTFSDLRYEAQGWGAGQVGPWQRMWATGFRGVLPRDHLLDLSFVADPKKGAFQTVVRRSHLAPGVGWLPWTGGIGEALMVGALVCGAGLALWLAGLSADQRPRAPRAAAVCSYLGRLAIYAGAALLLRTMLLALNRSLHLSQGPRLFLSGQLSPLAALFWATVLFSWSVVTLYFVARLQHAGPPRRWVFWVLAVGLGVPLLVGAVLAPTSQMQAEAKLGSPLWVGVAQLAAMLTVVAFSALVGAAANGALFGPARSQLLAAELGLVLAVTVAALPVTGLSRPPPQSARREAPPLTERTAKARGELQQALLRFREDRACYPATLAGLVAPPPGATGLDAAGNPVPVAPGPGAPALASLPADPLTGSPSTWLYDPLLPGLVDSGGFEVEITAPAAGAAEAPALRRFWAAPPAGAVRQALGPLAPMIWGAGDCLVRLDCAEAEAGFVRAVEIRLLQAVALRPGNPQGLEDAGYAATTDGSALLLSGCVHRDAGGDRARDRYAVMDIAGAGRRVMPLGTPLAERIVAPVSSPDGVRVACLTAGAAGAGAGLRLWSLEPPGVWVGPLSDHVARALWHPSGGYLLALIHRIGPDGKATPGAPCDLVRVWPDGRLDPLGSGEGYSDAVLAATNDEAFALSLSRRLEAVALDEKRITPLELGPGKVLDALRAGRGRVAVLVMGSDPRTRRQEPRLVMVDRREDSTSALPLKSPGAREWLAGRIIGTHETTGYTFVHLWGTDAAKGQVVMVGPTGAPAQEVPLLTR